MPVTVNMGFVATAGGTVDAITATYAPVPPSLYNGLLLWFVSSGANTITNPTFNPNGLGIRTIVKKGGQPLIAGDIGAAGFVAHVEYNLANTRWELLNPDNVVPSSRTLTINSTAFDLSANRSWTITAGYTYVGTSATPYVASSGEFVNVDASGGNKVVTPPASGFFAVRMAVGSGSNTVTVTGLDTLYIVGDVVEYLWDGAAFIKVSDGRKLHSGILERTTVQSITTATQVKILHNVAGTDYGGVTDLANSRFVVRRAGRVQIGMYGGMNVDDTEFMAHELWLNGARILNGTIRNSTTAAITFSTVVTLDVIAGDILEHYYQHGDATEDCLIGVNRPIFTLNEIRLI